MKQWVIVGCRAEAKVFERYSRVDDLHWVKTLVNKKGRRKERDFETDEPGMSYAERPHRLEGKHHHSEIVARHFAQQIARFIEKSYSENRFDQLTILAGAHFLGLLKAELKALTHHLEIQFVPKNVEKSQTEQIIQYLD